MRDHCHGVEIVSHRVKLPEKSLFPASRYNGVFVVFKNSPVVLSIRFWAWREMGEIGRPNFFLVASFGEM